MSGTFLACDLTARVLSPNIVLLLYVCHLVMNRARVDASQSLRKGVRCPRECRAWATVTV